MRQALQANPNDLNTRLAVAHWALDAGDLPLANEQAQAARKLDAESLAALSASGNVALSMQDYEQAQRYFEAVVAKAPNDFAATNGLILALCEQDSPEMKNLALQYAQSNLRNHPRSTEAAVLNRL